MKPVRPRRIPPLAAVFMVFVSSTVPAEALFTAGAALDAPFEAASPEITVHAGADADTYMPVSDRLSVFLAGGAEAGYRLTDRLGSAELSLSGDVSYRVGGFIARITADGALAWQNLGAAPELETGLELYLSGGGFTTSLYGSAAVNAAFESAAAAESDPALSFPLTLGVSHALSYELLLTAEASYVPILRPDAPDRRLLTPSIGVRWYPGALFTLDAEVSYTADRTLFPTTDSLDRDASDELAWSASAFVVLGTRANASFGLSGAFRSYLDQERYLSVVPSAGLEFAFSDRTLLAVTGEFATLSASTAGKTDIEASLSAEFAVRLE